MINTPCFQQSVGVHIVSIKMHRAIVRVTELLLLGISRCKINPYNSLVFSIICDVSITSCLSGFVFPFVRRPAVMILDMYIAKSENLSVHNQEVKQDRHSPRVKFNAIKIQYVIVTSDFRKNFEAKSFNRGKDRSF